MAKLDLTGFYNNVKSMARLCTKKGVKLVLMTHPLLPGKGFDPLSGGDLERVLLYEGSTGMEMALRNNRYAEVLRKIATEEGLVLIDFEKEYPRSSAYFFDHQHFTKKGSRLAAELTWKILKKELVNGTE